MFLTYLNFPETPVLVKEGLYNNSHQVNAQLLIIRRVIEMELAVLLLFAYSSKIK